MVCRFSDGSLQAALWSTPGLHTAGDPLPLAFHRLQPVAVHRLHPTSASGCQSGSSSVVDAASSSSSVPPSSSLAACSNSSSSHSSGSPPHSHRLSPRSMSMPGEEGEGGEGGTGMQQLAEPRGCTKCKDSREQPPRGRSQADAQPERRLCTHTRAHTLGAGASCIPGNLDTRTVVYEADLHLLCAHAALGHRIVAANRARYRRDQAHHAWFVGPAACSPEGSWQCPRCRTLLPVPYVILYSCRLSLSHLPSSRGPSVAGLYCGWSRPGRRHNQVGSPTRWCRELVTRRPVWSPLPPHVGGNLTSVLLPGIFHSTSMRKPGRRPSVAGTSCTAGWHRHARSGEIARYGGQAACRLVADFADVAWCRAQGHAIHPRRSTHAPLATHRILLLLILLLGALLLRRFVVFRARFFGRTAELVMQRGPLLRRAGCAASAAAARRLLRPAGCATSTARRLAFVAEAEVVCYGQHARAAGVVKHHLELAAPGGAVAARSSRFWAAACSAAEAGAR